MQGISEGTPLAKPARLAPLSKNPASKASVEHFFRVPPESLLALLALGAGVGLKGRWILVQCSDTGGGGAGYGGHARDGNRGPVAQRLQKTAARVGCSASLLARIRAPNSHARSRPPQEKKIKELLQDLTSDLAVNQPDDPSRYLYDKIGSFFGAASALSHSISCSVCLLSPQALLHN